MYELCCDAHRSHKNSQHSQLPKYCIPTVAESIKETCPIPNTCITCSGTLLIIEPCNRTHRDSWIFFWNLGRLRQHVPSNLMIYRRTLIKGIHTTYMVLFFAHRKPISTILYSIDSTTRVAFHSCAFKCKQVLVHGKLGLNGSKFTLKTLNQFHSVRYSVPILFTKNR